MVGDTDDLTVSKDDIVWVDLISDLVPRESVYLATGVVCVWELTQETTTAISSSRCQIDEVSCYTLPLFDR